MGVAAGQDVAALALAANAHSKPAGSAASALCLARTHALPRAAQLNDIIQGWPGTLEHCLKAPEEDFVGRREPDGAFVIGAFQGDKHVLSAPLL